MTLENTKTFETYLNLSYNPTTVKHYLRLFKVTSSDLFTQEGMDVFLQQHLDSYNYINPLYRGFAKAVIDCFNLKVVVPKSRRKGKKGHDDYKFITKEQIDAIINIADPRIQLITRLFFETGLRLREMFNLRLEDVDLNERMFKGIGKGNKPFRVKFSSRSSDMLFKYMLHHEDKLLFGDKNKHPYRAFQYRINKLGKLVGVENMTPHRLRHALGHYLRAEKGFDLEQIRVKLRHSDVSTTQIYAKAEQEEVDNKMDYEVFGNG